MIVIQGTADVSNADGKLSQNELNKTLDFCAHAFEPTLPEDRQTVLEKLNGLTIDHKPSSISCPISANANGAPGANGHAPVKDKESDTFNTSLTAEEQRILAHIRARRMMRTEDTMNIASFSTDVIDGLAARLERGRLGLVRKV